MHSAGISQSSKNTSEVGDVVSSSFWSGLPVERPRVPLSTRNAVMPDMPFLRSTVANTRKRSATGALVAKVLEPFST